MKRKSIMKRQTALLLAALLVLSSTGELSSVNAANYRTSAVTAQAAVTEEYEVRDAFFDLADESVNRMTSEHFQIIWGNEDTTGTVNEEFVAGNLKNLEAIWSFYVNVLEMKEIGTSQNPELQGTKYKTNLYISNTGLGDVVMDDWAYMSVDAGSFGYMVLMPGAMRVDEPSWVVPHELAHVFTYHQGGIVQEGWYEATANWFRDQYLGSEYYAYGDNVYGPVSDFFAPYILNSDYYFPHLKNWYDAWPILLYISENPDNIDGLGMDLIHKLLENDTADDTLFATIERLSGVSVKEILGGLTRRLVTMDFSRQQYYLGYLNDLLAESGNYEKIYTTLTEGSDGYLYVADDRAPMQGGYNIIPLDVNLSKAGISVEFVSTSTEADADFRACIVTKNAANETSYSDIFNSGTASIALKGDETAAYLVVCATPDTMQALYIYDENLEGTRYTYKAKITGLDSVSEGGSTDTDNGSTEDSSGSVDTDNGSTEDNSGSADNGNTGDNSGSTDTDAGSMGNNSGSTETDKDEPSTEIIEQITVVTKEHSFDDAGLESDFYAIKGKLSTKKGTAQFEGTTYKKCLKLESSTSVSFTNDKEAELTLVFADGAEGTIKIDGKTYQFTDGVFKCTLSAGEHKITKGTVENLFFMRLSMTEVIYTETIVENSTEENTEAGSSNGEITDNSQNTGNTDENNAGSSENDNNNTVNAEKVDAVYYLNVAEKEDLKFPIELGNNYAWYVKSDERQIDYMKDFDFEGTSLVLKTSYLDTLRPGVNNIYVGISDNTEVTVRIRVTYADNAVSVLSLEEKPDNWFRGFFNKFSNRRLRW